MVKMEDRGISLLNAKEDRYGGVIVNVEEPMDSMAFASLLQSSMSSWREQGKKGVWIKLPIEHIYLVETVVKAGFRYHHAEADYLMLVHWIPNTADTLPANASHRVGIGAFVMNDKREVLVVQEGSGWFKGTGVWKLPTGTVEEGEDICDAAVREVKEETGIETEFVEILAFRQSHKSFFQKSDIMFVCMLQARSFGIQMQTSELAAAKWMPIEDYAAQPFVKQNSGFDSVAKICLEKLDGNYTGFTPLPTFSSSGKKNIPISSELTCSRDIIMSSVSPSIEAHRDGRLPPGGEEARRKRSILHMMGIEDEQKFGKYLLGVAIPMVVTLVLSSSSLVHTTEVRIVVVSLSAAVLLTCTGLSLHGIFPQTSSWMLLSGVVLMTLSFFALITRFLPPNLKWIPAVFCLAFLITPFAMSAWNYFSCAPPGRQLCTII